LSIGRLTLGFHFRHKLLPLAPSHGIQQCEAIEQELESVAIIDRKVMVPMRDGKRMAADIYIPKDTSRRYRIIFMRTPYNFNYWDVHLGAPRDLSKELSAVKRGYALVQINERGKLFSEGNWGILGAPLSDGDDELTWMSAQPWSNGKVGIIGCSSSAEWQLGVHRLVTRPSLLSCPKVSAPAWGASRPAGIVLGPEAVVVGSSGTMTPSYECLCHIIGKPASIRYKRDRSQLLWRLQLRRGYVSHSVLQLRRIQAR
jgi:hypothetical protein